MRTRAMPNTADRCLPRRCCRNCTMSSPSGTTAGGRVRWTGTGGQHCRRYDRLWRIAAEQLAGRAEQSLSAWQNRPAWHKLTSGGPARPRRRTSTTHRRSVEQERRVGSAPKGCTAQQGFDEGHPCRNASQETEVFGSSLPAFASRGGRPTDGGGVMIERLEQQRS
jgi:hypothetical protein